VYYGECATIVHRLNIDTDGEQKMKRFLDNTIIITGFVVGLLFSQAAISGTPARAFVFDGKLLTASDLQKVQVSLPGLYNPLTGQPSTREDFEKPVVITKGFDINSSVFEAAQFNKNLLPEVILEIDILSAKGQQSASYLIIKMKNVHVTSYQTGGSAASDVPVETITLNYEEIKFEYNTQAIDLRDTIITSYQTGGDANGTAMTESISLNFSRIEWDYPPH